jgi:hypothetical protein
VLRIEGLLEQALSTFLLTHDPLGIFFKAKLHNVYFITKERKTPRGIKSVVFLKKMRIMATRRAA